MHSPGHMHMKSANMLLWGLAAAALLPIAPAAGQSAAPPPQQEVAVLRVDWDDPELKRFAAAKAAGAAASASVTKAGHDKLAALRLPVLAFEQVPQLIRNALGPNAKTLKPRTVITDPAAPVWYNIIDHYGDISITIDADLRVNHAHDDDFRIHGRPLSLDGVKQGGKSKISVFDGAKDEGMEGVIVEYTVYKFPDVPYTVTIECRGAAKRQCKDVATIAKDQALLKVIAAR